MVSKCAAPVLKRFTMTIPNFEFAPENILTVCMQVLSQHVQGSSPSTVCLKIDTISATLNFLYLAIWQVQKPSKFWESWDHPHLPFQESPWKSACWNFGIPICLSGRDRDRFATLMLNPRIQRWPCRRGDGRKRMARGKCWENAMWGMHNNDQ